MTALLIACIITSALCGAYLFGRAIGRMEVSDAVANLWVCNNGWIPGGDRKILSAILDRDLPEPERNRGMS